MIRFMIQCYRSINRLNLKMSDVLSDLVLNTNNLVAVRVRHDMVVKKKLDSSQSMSEQCPKFGDEMSGYGHVA